MHRLATLFQRYAWWLQMGVVALLLILLTLQSWRATDSETANQGYLQMLGSLSLPYLLSGDNTTLRQTLDLLVQDSPVLEVSVFNTENRRVVQVFNRDATEQQRLAAIDSARELVLDQTLLGTLAISVDPPQSAPPWSTYIGLALLALVLVVPNLLGSSPDSTTDGCVPSSNPRPRSRERYLVAISLRPWLIWLKQAGRNSTEASLNLRKMVLRLAPSYGLEFVCIDEETLFLRSQGDDSQSLRQAMVFAWNFCHSQGEAERNLLSAHIDRVELSDDQLLGQLTLADRDWASLYADILADNRSGVVTINGEMSQSLPKDWNLDLDDGRHLRLLNELPAPLCNLWRRQLKSLENTA